jgi:hypothetical protein
MYNNEVQSLDVHDPVGQPKMRQLQIHEPAERDVVRHCFELMSVGLVPPFANCPYKCTGLFFGCCVSRFPPFQLASDVLDGPPFLIRSLLKKHCPISYVRCVRNHSFLCTSTWRHHHPGSDSAARRSRNDSLSGCFVLRVHLLLEKRHLLQEKLQNR